MPINQFEKLQNEIIHCRKCLRLVAWCEKVATDKVRRFAHENYWGKPVPSFGDFDASVLVVGLAPAAHGGTRTGRVFTGDRSGDWLFRALHKFNFSNRPTSTDRNDGLILKNCYITAALHCAPPQNKPTTEEKNNCLPYLLKELQLLKELKIIVALGKIAFDTVIRSYGELGLATFDKRPVFGHGNEARLNERVTLIASYHPSQQNTFTGKLTEPMFDAIFKKALALIKSSY